MAYPEIVDYELLEELLQDEKNEGETSIDVLEVAGSDVKWYRNQNEIALDEILSRTSDATLRVL
jgi:hypothetical protein